MLLVVVGLSTMAQAQPGTLTLACKGTTTTSLPDTKPEPLTMGIIVNFATRTVQGFGHPGLLDYPVKITGANDVTVAFSGSHDDGTSISSISGTIDRVTGTVEATSALISRKTHEIQMSTTYDLQCRPTQRMF
jgi:hypothetical protein